MASRNRFAAESSSVQDFYLAANPRGGLSKGLFLKDLCQGGPPTTLSPPLPSWHLRTRHARNVPGSNGPREGPKKPQSHSSIENVFQDEDTLISPLQDKISVNLEQKYLIQKRKKGTLWVKVRNLTTEPTNIYVMMDSTEQILRIG